MSPRPSWLGHMVVLGKTLMTRRPTVLLRLCLMTDVDELKESEKLVGQLNPVLKNKKGEVVYGFHRLKSNPKWRTRTDPNLSPGLPTLIARVHENLIRREV